jgi:hypothetical protein
MNTDTIYDTTRDTHLTTLFIDGDQDIDAELYHSEEHGYYLRRIISQKHDGVSWVTMQFAEPIEDQGGNYRSLKTYRRLDHGEVARLVCGQFVPEEEGLRAKVLDALAKAGIVQAPAAAETLTQLGGIFLAKLRELGGSAGKKTLCLELNWDAAKYDRVMGHLVDIGRIVRAAGRGGIVRLVEE